MKILIFYATYGGGHLSVAKAMEEVILREYPEIDVEVIDCMKTLNKPINFITVKGYEGLNKKMPKMWGKIYKASRKGIVANFSNVINKILSLKLGKLIEEKKPDIIISAHPFSTQMCGILKKKGKLNIPVCTILTDFKYHEQWLEKHEYLEKFFCSNEKMRQSLIAYGLNENKVFTTGLPISQKFLEEFDKEEIRKEFMLKENMKTILFFAGGRMGLATKNITTFMEVLAKNSKKIQVIAVSGKNPKVYEKFKNIANKNNNIKVLEFTNKVPELMSISDLVITKPGGITVSESLASKLPIIVVNPIPGQEEENAEFLEENGLAIWIKDNKNIEKDLNSIINDDQKLKQIKENIEKIRRPNAAKEICEIILKNNLK